MIEFQVLNGDCRDVLKSLADGSVDSIVTDPPYELGFMGKAWDASGIAYDQTVWAECLRVLKPGGHLLAFGGSRTYHRMACAIEDAGFEIRDQIMWVYGSGFPKSLDVSKAIDKRGGVVADFATFRDAVKEAMERNGVTRAQVADALGNHMLSHYLTEGSQPAIPNQRDYYIIRDTVALGSDFDHLFLPAADRPITGQHKTDMGGLGGKRLGKAGTERRDLPSTDDASRWSGWGTALKPAHEPIVLARKPLVGTVAANVLQHGTGALNIDGCRVSGALEGDPNRFAKTDGGSFAAFTQAPVVRSDGRWPANFIHDGSDEATDLMGEAARFFYCAKASKVDRNDGLDGFTEQRPDTRTETGMGTFTEKGVAKQRNHHPTVKPTDLMRYLVRLVTPPNGIVLDPFTGSGSTGKAAVIEGFSFIGIEQDPDYAAIATARITHALNTREETLFDD